jgi:hypothetical protein
MMNDWLFLPLILSRILFRLEILEGRKQFLGAAHPRPLGWHGAAARPKSVRSQAAGPLRNPVTWMVCTRVHYD